MKRVFLLTGSNLGDRSSLMKRAEVAIGSIIGKVVQKSHIYKSESWGYKSSGFFYNQCLEIETDLDPHSILKEILNIETKLGRTRVKKDYSDRFIDIDILFYGDEIIRDEHLTIPHPRMHLRKFAMVPLNEIAGDFIHPVFQTTVSELLVRCKDDSEVILEY